MRILYVVPGNIFPRGLDSYFSWIPISTVDVVNITYVQLRPPLTGVRQGDETFFYQSGDGGVAGVEETHTPQCRSYIRTVIPRKIKVKTYYFLGKLNNLHQKGGM